jgi:DNA topoisomerase-1
MPTTEEHKGPTPAGGVRSKIIYLKDGVLADKADADAAEVLEYDKDDRVIRRTYLSRQTGSTTKGAPQQVRKAAGTCEQGQTQALTGCTPATPTSGRLTGRQRSSSSKPIVPTKPPKTVASRGAMQEARREGKGKEARVVLADGTPAPAHIKPSMVPPDWTEVKVAKDSVADVLVTARDKAGRIKTVYADNFHMRQAAAKFARVKEGMEKAEVMWIENQRNRHGPSKEEADCLWLVQEQGTRPGSDSDTKAKVKAYGATTLLGQHVTPVYEDVEGRGPILQGVRLQFIGKEGVSHDHLIRDPELAAMLLKRSKAVGPDGKLFDTNDGKLRDYTRTLDGGDFTPKDFRTMLATHLALEEIKRLPNPASEKQYKAQVKQVAERVSRVLGNKPAQAIESYISPTVWASWRKLYE